jgi:hypothetical protein
MKGCRQEKFPSNDSREEDCVGNGANIHNRNEKRRFHLAPGVHERIIAESLIEPPGLVPGSRPVFRNVFALPERKAGNSDKYPKPVPACQPKE